MRIIIIGAGVTGSELARRLIVKNHDVVLIERNEDTARHAANTLDCMVVHASANEGQILTDAHITKADALVTVTDSDELNMIICGIAESLAPKVRKIARVRNENYVKSLNTGNERTLGINSLVYPDEEAAHAIIKIIKHGAISNILSFDDSSYEIIRFNISKNSILNDVVIKDIHKYIQVPFIVVAIEQNGKNKIPSGETILTAGTRMSILTKPEYIERFYELAGFETSPFKKIAVVGSSRIGKLLIEDLIKNVKGNIFQQIMGKTMKHGWKLSIIDKNDKEAKAAAAAFPKADVFCGDVTDEVFCEEINLKSFDLVISTTENYEFNMITSIYLKTLGVYKTIALVQSAVMENIAYKMGIDVAVSFKSVVVDSIMAHLLGKNITSFHSMGEGKLEIIELSISSGSAVAGKKLKEISQHGIFLILLINKNSSYAIPTGDTELSVGDKVAFIVKSSESDGIIRIFTGQK